MKKIFSKNYLVLLIFSVALATRLYHLPTRAIFTADEEYQATYARTIVQDFHPVWIGVSAGDTGFYLGPYFTYFTALWLALSGGDPLITAYVAAILGSITCILLYYLGKTIVSQSVGIIAAFLYALSPWVVYHDQRYWNPSPAPMLAILLLLSLIKLKSSSWWLVVTAFALGAFWHVHLSLVPLTLVAMYAIWQYRRFITPRVWLISSLVFIIMLAPLLIFDYYHDWSNLLTPIRLLARGGQGIQVVDHFYSLGETLARTLYLDPGTVPASEIRPGKPGGIWTSPGLTMIVLALSALLLPIGNPYLVIALIIMVCSYILYPGDVTGYYALGLVPIYFLGLAKFLTRYRLGYLLVIVFTILSIRTLWSTSESYGLTAKRELITQVTTYLGDDSFTLSEEGTAHKYGGWRYLFTVYGKYPVSSSADAYLSWLYPAEIGGPSKYHVSVGATAEFLPPPDSLALYQSGGYTAYIIESMSK